jgi:hypothetical protein
MFQNYPPKLPRINLSFGIEKTILSQLKEEVTAEQFTQIVLSSYALVYSDELVMELEEHLVSRVLARIEELQKPQEQTKSGRTKKSFGTAFSEWLAGLSGTESCLYLANYDIEKALHLYWQEDLLLVQDAIKAKTAQDSQNSLIQLEASMYGFGGRYSDDAKDDANTINLDDVNASDIQGMLGGFGF